MAKCAASINMAIAVFNLQVCRFFAFCTLIVLASALCSCCMTLWSLAAASHSVTLLQVCTALRWTVTVGTLELLTCAIMVLMARSMCTAASINMQAMAIVAFISHLCPFAVFCALIVLASMLMHIDSLCLLLRATLQARRKGQNSGTISVNSFGSAVRCLRSLDDRCPLGFLVLFLLALLVVVDISWLRGTSINLLGSAVECVRSPVTAVSRRLVCTGVISLFGSAVRCVRSPATAVNYRLVCTEVIHLFGSAVRCVRSSYDTAVNCPLVLWTAVLTIYSLVSPQLSQHLAYHGHCVACVIVVALMGCHRNGHSTFLR